MVSGRSQRLRDAPACQGQIETKKCSGPWGIPKHDEQAGYAGFWRVRQPAWLELIDTRLDKPDIHTCPDFQKIDTPLAKLSLDVGETGRYIGAKKIAIVLQVALSLPLSPSRFLPTQLESST